MSTAKSDPYEAFPAPPLAHGGFPGVPRAMVDEDYRAQRLEAAAKAVVAFAETAAPGLTCAVPWDVLRNLAAALEEGS